MNNCRTDINEGGQAQKRLLPESSAAYKFYEKWDKKHLQVLTEDEIKECLSDIEKLKEQYDYVCIVDRDRNIGFQDEVNLQRKDVKMLEHVRSIIKEFDYKIHEN